MSCRNPYKHKIQKVVDNWLNVLSVKKKLSDDQIKCMLFGICEYSPRKIQEVPFFITKYYSYKVFDFPKKLSNHLPS